MSLGSKFAGYPVTTRNAVYFIKGPVCIVQYSGVWYFNVLNPGKFWKLYKSSI